jgi:hypothetical protein
MLSQLFKGTALFGKVYESASTIIFSIIAICIIIFSSYNLSNMDNYNTPVTILLKETYDSVNRRTKVFVTDKNCMSILNTDFISGLPMCYEQTKLNQENKVVCIDGREIPPFVAYMKDDVSGCPQEVKFTSDKTIKNAFIIVIVIMLFIMLLIFVNLYLVFKYKTVAAIEGAYTIFDKLFKFR